MIGNLVQIRPLVTQHPSKGLSKQRSHLEFNVFFHYFAIFYINYFIITCLMPFRIIFHKTNTLDYLLSIRIDPFSHSLK